MLCGHIVCSKCTSSNGICKKYIDKSLTLIKQTGLRKQASRASKYIDVSQLHLTRMPDDDDEVAATEEDSDSDAERERDSSSDDSNDDDVPKDALGGIEIVQQSVKSRQVQAMSTVFFKQIEELQVPHAAVVPAIVLQPGAVTEQDGDALLLPASTSVTAAAQVPPTALVAEFDIIKKCGTEVAL